MSQGYLNALYVESLREFGTPLHLPRSNGWLLERPIEGTSLRDAMGPYPLFACDDWSKLREDLEDHRGRLVSVALVTDPFAPVSPATLGGCFDRVWRFKEHFVLDLSKPAAVSNHHRYYARRGLREVRITRQDRLDAAALDRWIDLYTNLVRRHSLTGIRAFSRESFAAQFRVPGVVMLEACHGDKVVGAHLWYVQGDKAYSHLMALDVQGYLLQAGYALYWEAIHSSSALFGPQVRWLTLGAGAGVDAASDDGLTWFKRGWSDETRPVYLCGKVLERENYSALSHTKGTAQSSYFPAYRAGEFG